MSLDAANKVSEKFFSFMENIDWLCVVCSAILAVIMLFLIFGICWLFAVGIIVFLG